MTLTPERLGHLSLEDRLTAVEAKLQDVDARIQALSREGKHDEMRLAQASFHFLEAESRTLRRMMEDESFGAP